VCAWNNSPVRDGSVALYGLAQRTVVVLNEHVGGNVKTRVLRVDAACLVLTGLSFTTGCGDGSGERSEEEHSAKEPVAASPLKVLSQAELERAAVGAQDLPMTTVDWLSAATLPHQPPIEPAACQAVSDTLDLVDGYPPSARVVRVISREGQFSISMSLAAHTPADAARVIPDVRAAARSCKAAFAPNYGFQYEAVAALPDPGLGDESASFKLVQIVEVGKGRPVKVPMTFVAVRTGSTVAIFHASNIRGGQAAVVPADVVDAQLTKLARTA